MTTTTMQLDHHVVIAEAATKSLLGMSAGGAYYGSTSSVYQPGAYATVQGSPLYGSTQNYYQRALKGTTASYPLAPYFGAATGTTSSYYGEIGADA